jgi:hypothetical protein
MAGRVKTESGKATADAIEPANPHSRFEQPRARLGWESLDPPENRR